MPKISFIGAGSTVFAKNLLGDILQFPELATSTISLHDINAQRLRETEIVAHKIAEKLGVNPTIETTTERRRSLNGADYAINMIQVGGYDPCTITDFEIPKKYGLRQTIADTLGIGGIMRALRTIPVMLDMAHDMEAVCPDVLHLNYVNPMAMLCWALARGSKVKTVGLCHSVQGTARQLSRDIGVPIDEINYICAGINHMAFYLRFERDGEDLYPMIHKVIEEGRVPDTNRVRYDMLKRVGYFITESSEHLSEYTPWYIKRDRPDLIEQFNIPLDEYIYRCQIQLKAWEFTQGVIKGTKEADSEALLEEINDIPSMPEMKDWVVGGFERMNEITPSHEYGSLIIHSMEMDVPRVIYGNVPNHGLIDNLPQDCVVEVPCLVDKGGVQPTKIGALPPQLAALMQTNINVQSLTVEAALTAKKEHIYQAAMLDPHAGAELSLDQIWSMVDEMITAHGNWLPDFT
jgi:alpha-galactosidase